MEHILGSVAVIGPLAGALSGVAVGTVRKSILLYAAQGFLAGYLCLLVYMMWSVPNWRQHYEKYVQTPDSWKQDAPADMRELIDAETAEQVVTFGSAAIAFAGLVGILVGLFYRRVLAGSALVFASGTQAYLLWCTYNWHCRYDPVTEYFGLEKVRVLGINFAMFVTAGIATGVLFGLMARSQQQLASERVSE